MKEDGDRDKRGGVGGIRGRNKERKRGEETRITELHYYYYYYYKGKSIS